MVKQMDAQKKELIETLKEIAEVSGRLARKKNDDFLNVIFKVATRMAELEAKEISEKAVFTTLRDEGYINSEQLAQILDTDS